MIVVIGSSSVSMGVISSEPLVKADEDLLQVALHLVETINDHVGSGADRHHRVAQAGNYA
jgi:hypothetical protein